MSKEMIFGIMTEDKIGQALSELSAIVGSTMGPAGNNVMIQRGMKDPIITKDGVTIAKEASTEDPTGNMTMFFVNGACESTVRAVGDGTTTTTVLVDAIYKNIKSLSEKRRLPLVLSEVEATIKEIVAALRMRSIPMYKEMIHPIALMASNGDIEIANMLSFILKESTDIKIKVIKSRVSLEEDKVEIMDGATMKGGLFSVNFVNNGKGTASSEKPFVFISNEIVSKVEEIAPLIDVINGKPVLMVLEDIKEEALNTILSANRRKVSNITIVKAPGYGDKRLSYLEDMAAATGTRVLGSTEGGTDIREVTIDDLGTCESFVANSNTTTFYGCKGDISERISLIEGMLEETDNTLYLKERLALLKGDVAIVTVGGRTIVERGDRFDLYEDAVGSLRAAIDGGVVPGGGTALANFHTKEFYKHLVFLTSPAERILSNAGLDFKPHKEWGEGIDARTGKTCNVMVSGIIDPTEVVIESLLNAFSAAKTLLKVKASMFERGGLDNDLIGKNY